MDRIRWYLFVVMMPRAEHREHTNTPASRGTLQSEPNSKRFYDCVNTKHRTTRPHAATLECRRYCVAIHLQQNRLWMRPNCFVDRKMRCFSGPSPIGDSRSRGIKFCSLLSTMASINLPLKECACSSPPALSASRLFRLVSGKLATAYCALRRAQQKTNEEEKKMIRISKLR